MNRSITLMLLTTALFMSLQAQAHRAWMLPSATVLSGEAPWITVDAAVSNDLFYFEHFPMLLEGVGTPGETAGRQRQPAQLLILAPDGSRLHPLNGNIGRLRSSFDLELTQKGTYKLAIASEARVSASYMLDGERQRWMGDLDKITEEIPANAESLDVTRTENRMEVFVTSGNLTESVFSITGQGLELQPVTHPNDLFSGEPARFQFLLDGQPASGLDVTVVPGGNRYRDDLGDMHLQTNADGIVEILWPTPGMYWLEAEYSSSEGLSPPLNRRRASYSSTLEVLAP